MRDAQMRMIAWILASLLHSAVPALATEMAPAEQGPTAAVIRRIEAISFTASNGRGTAHGSSGAVLDARAREFANLRAQAAALRRALDAFVASMEREIQRLQPAAQRSESPQAVPAAAKSLKAGPQPAAVKAAPPTSKTSNAAPSR
jgi:hypothetical protein